MIVSASRRTDIPAFYSDWFFRRLEEGYLYVKNPMNPRQVSKILLSQDTVDCFVFWTKDPGPMMERLSVLDRLGYPYYFQFTLTPYGTDVEPGLPHKNELVRTFRELSCRLGPERVIWRYDPVLLSPSYTREYHFQWFSRLCGSLEGYTHTCVISFLDIYRKIKGRMEQIQPRTMTGSHFCRYCYANFSPAQVEANRRMHDPESPLLCGRLTGEERITVREMKSAVRPADDGQMRLGFHDAELMQLTGKPGRII